jgi:predicted GIY-YIG superfamily endonuclease
VPFSVYLITGPTGKQYAGVSKDVKARWQSHRRRAREGERRHPLLDAIRKYGASAFTVSVVRTFDNQEDARAYEVFEIAARRLNDRSRGYNVSRGGEYDCLDGPKKFWAEVKSDPVRYEAYLENCRAAGRKRAEAGLIDSSALVAYVKARSARDVHAQQRRATRVAAKRPHRNGGPKTPSGNAAAVKAAWDAQPPSFKKRHAIASRKSARDAWAQRTPEQRADVATKISASVQALSNDPAYRAKNLAGLAKGRKNMDRSIQGAAASAGLKKFWSDLRKDPARYEAYISSRVKSLSATLKAKAKNAR